MKNHVLTRTIVPFLPLTEDELADVVKTQLASVGTTLIHEGGHRWHGTFLPKTSVPKLLAARCVQ